jgi:Fe-Mn family superoxide dismutase
MPSGLTTHLKSTFTSIENLKAEMLAAAYSMFGPGFVWLVRTDAPGKRSSYQDYNNSSRTEFKILTTYLAGSPLAGAHNRAQPLDMNTQNVNTAVAAGGVKGLSQQHLQVQNTVGTYSQRDMETSYGGVKVTPCLCVNTWQHAWMFDFTVDGKEEFLRRWWNLVNWEKVARIADISNDSKATEYNAGVYRKSESFQRN